MGAPCSYARAGAKYKRQKAISRLTSDPISAIFRLIVGRSFLTRALSMSIAQRFSMSKCYSRRGALALGKDPHCRFRRNPKLSSHFFAVFRYTPYNETANQHGLETQVQQPAQLPRPTLNFLMIALASIGTVYFARQALRESDF